MLLPGSDKKRRSLPRLIWLIGLLGLMLSPLAAQAGKAHPLAPPSTVEGLAEFLGRRFIEQAGRRQLITLHCCFWDIFFPGVLSFCFGPGC